ncbi:MAG: hypothetical protein AB7S78_02880 [Candidatus Omnitrophota bacterium]
MNFNEDRWEKDLQSVQSLIKELRKSNKIIKLLDRHREILLFEKLKQIANYLDLTLERTFSKESGWASLEEYEKDLKLLIDVYNKRKMENNQTN